MKFIAEIDIMPLKELLDPQGKAVVSNLKNLNLTQIQDVRIGKHTTLTIEADNIESATEMTEAACKQILANPVMEYFEYEVNPA